MSMLKKSAYIFFTKKNTKTKKTNNMIQEQFYNTQRLKTT